MSEVKKTIFTIALLGSLAFVFSIWGAHLLLHKTLVGEADSHGMDWAHYIEDNLTSLKEDVGLDAPATRTELKTLFNGVFSVGHILQIDYLHRDCGYCMVSFGAHEFQKVQSGHDDQNHQDHGYQRDEFSRQVRDRSEVTPPAPIPIDRQLLDRIIAENGHEIFIHRQHPHDALGTFAEVFHPVESDTGTVYVLRVLVDLQEQDNIFRDLLTTGVLVSLLLLTIVIGVPTQQLIRSLQKQAAADKEAAFFANHDVLTSLPNRNSFQENAQDMIWQCRHDGREMALYLFDLNGFKEVNDYYGHNVGDNLLCAFATLLMDVAPEDAFIARLGGDEFVVATFGPVASGDNFLGMPKHVEFQMPDSQTLVRAGISGGVAQFPKDGENLNDLMQSADLALYSAKSIAGGSIRAFEPGLRDAFFNRLNIINEFRTAVKQGQIEPFYQPIADIQTGRIAGFEALARWRHPDRGVLTPYHFTEALNDNLISAAVGKAMLIAVVSDMVEWSNQGVDFGKVAINVSTGDLKSATYAADVLERLETAEIAPGALTLEVTENCLFGKEKHRFIEHLETLKAAGCNIALDDFGTGYSSITQLKDIPISVVKIDKSFVDSIASDKSDQAIISALRDMGRLMSFDLIVEGVETEIQASYFKENGYKLAQGYLYGKPVPFHDVPAVIERLEGRGQDEKRVG